MPYGVRSRATINLTASVSSTPPVPPSSSPKSHKTAPDAPGCPIVTQSRNLKKERHTTIRILKGLVGGARATPAPLPRRLAAARSPRCATTTLSASAPAPSAPPDYPVQSFPNNSSGTHTTSSCLRDNPTMPVRPSASQRMTTPKYHVNAFRPCVTQHPNSPIPDTSN